MNIKVCGITQLKQLQQLDGLEIDFAGLDFHPASPRYAANGLKGSEVKNADFDLKKTGVFLDMDYDFIMRLVEEYGLDVVQLNGKESPELCEDLSDEVEVIKSFHISPATTNVDELIADYDEVCDYFLFDSLQENGAAGRTKLDFGFIAKARIEKPFFLDGNINLTDIPQLKVLRHPDLYAVDLNEMFEKEPGVKDMGLILQFRQGMK
ncbi:MAG: phosphoribosylanthranilate isomerase [Chitinophagaceae bacterium]|nr:phosphoribosylanthranilate isomerase [Chitinophagaceae bacterium]